MAARTIHLGISSRTPAKGVIYSVNSACAAFVRFNRPKLVTMETEKVTCKKCLKSIEKKTVQEAAIAIYVSPSFQAKMDSLFNGEAC